MRALPEPELFLYFEEEDGSIHMAPLLTCGHYGKPIFECSSLWDFPADAHTCPECGEERQMDLRVQLAVMATW